MSQELLRHLTFKSDLVIGQACYNYGLLFELLKTVAVVCYQHVFHKISSRCWIGQELQNVPMDDHVEFENHIRRANLDEFVVGPAVENTTSFLSACPKLSKKEYIWNYFKLCCPCLGHVAPKLPHMLLGSSKVGTTDVDLSCVIEPIQRYLLSCVCEGNFFADSESVSSC